MVEGPVVEVALDSLPAVRWESYAVRAGWDPRESGPAYAGYVVTPRLVQAWREYPEARRPHAHARRHLAGLTGVGPSDRRQARRRHEPVTPMTTASTSDPRWRSPGESDCTKTSLPASRTSMACARVTGPWLK